MTATDDQIQQAAEHLIRLLEEIISPLIEAHLNAIYDQGQEPETEIPF